MPARDDAARDKYATSKYNMYITLHCTETVFITEFTNCLFFSLLHKPLHKAFSLFSTFGIAAALALLVCFV